MESRKTLRYDFPEGLKPTPVGKRERFYREEFPAEQVAERMERWHRFVPVIDIGTETTLYKPRLQDMKGKLVQIKEYNDVPQLAEKIADYAPEDVYYNRTIGKEGRIDVNPEQELVFRIAPHELSCHSCDRKRRHIEDRWTDYVFCRSCFTDAANHARSLYAFLERHFGDMDLVYSGRAFHIHVNDEEGYRMTIDDRNELAQKVKSQFPIDQRLTAGDKELIRLPGSLNGLVSRKAVLLAVTDLSDPDYILNMKSVPDSFEE